MPGQIPHSSRRSTNSFQQVLSGFFKQPGLPFSGVLTAEIIESVFRGGRCAAKKDRHLNVDMFSW